ncbi:site-specific integrase [Halomonas sediminis]
MPYGTYLTRSRHRTNWYARIVIPHDLRHAYHQRREIRKTLDTPCKITARRRAMLLWLAYQQVFESLRNGQVESSVTPEWNALASLASTLPTDIAPQARLAYQILHIIPLIAINQSGEKCACYKVRINAVTGEFGFDQPSQAALEGAEGFLKPWWRGKPKVEQGRASESLQTVLAQVSPPDKVSPCMSVLFEQFAAERLAEAREKTIETMRQHLHVFIELMGDLPTDKLTKSVVRAFIRLLKTYPAHRNHGRWKTMTLAEIRAVGKQSIGDTTQHNIIGNLHTFAGWLVEVDELESNPFKIKLRKKPKVPDPDRTWTEEELSRWFHSDLLHRHRGSNKYAWKYWLPLIAIYSGARLEELAALSPEDFFEYSGVQAFKIHAEDGRFVKNASSWRVVPVHSQLLRMGLLEYVASRKGNERLFTIEPYKGQYGKRASKAFGYLREKLEISPDFHGYRHTMIEALKMKGVPLTHVEWLVGHTGASMSDHYGSATDKRKWLPVLQEVVELLDWSHVMPRDGY